MLAHQFATGCYTHHQKTVICDEEDANGKFNVIAFIGGLDITTGRYDTPEFPLFKTLQTVHKDDFRNKCFPGLPSRIDTTNMKSEISRKHKSGINVFPVLKFVQMQQKQLVLESHGMTVMQKLRVLWPMTSRKTLMRDGVNKVTTKLTGCSMFAVINNLPGSMLQLKLGVLMVGHGLFSFSGHSHLILPFLML